MFSYIIELFLKHIKLSLIILVMFLIGCNDTKTSPDSENDNQNTNTSKVQLKEELPPSNICKSDLGVLKMDANGYSIGKKTELTELKKYLKDNSCDIIEITYELKGSYGDNINKKIIYNKREKMLQDIFTRNNVIEDYKNVSTDGLKKFLEAGEKSFYSLTDYTESEYDFNNREMTNRAVGKKPSQSEWDGSVDVVEKFIKSNAKDASSIEFLEWSKVSSLDEYWIVRCKYQGSNSFGASVTENKWFYIQNENVVKTKDIL